MIRNKKDRTSPEVIEIDLTGPEGNAFSLLAVAKDLAHINKFDWDNREEDQEEEDDFYDDNNQSNFIDNDPLGLRS
jgi:hypothetical protein